MTFTVTWAATGLTWETPDSKVDLWFDAEPFFSTRDKLTALRGMITKLTPEQEGHLLTDHLKPGGDPDWEPGKPGCFWQIACQDRHGFATREGWSSFDSLCANFGVGRIGARIRNRILLNRLRRTLTAPLPETITT